MATHFDQELDTRGLACPIPIVKARQAMNGLGAGQTLRVLSTDRGSVKDFQGWVQAARNLALLEQSTETMDGREIYIHYVQKQV